MRDKSPRKSLRTSQRPACTTHHLPSLRTKAAQFNISKCIHNLFRQNALQYAPRLCTTDRRFAPAVRNAQGAIRIGPEVGNQFASVAVGSEVRSLTSGSLT